MSHSISHTIDAGLYGSILHIHSTGNVRIVRIKIGIIELLILVLPKRIHGVVHIWLIISWLLYWLVALVVHLIVIGLDEPRIYIGILMGVCKLVQNHLVHLVRVHLFLGLVPLLWVLVWDKAVVSSVAETHFYKSKRYYRKYLCIHL